MNEWCELIAGCFLCVFFCVFFFVFVFSIWAQECADGHLVCAPWQEFKLNNQAFSAGGQVWTDEHETTLWQTVASFPDQLYIIHSVHNSLLASFPALPTLLLFFVLITYQCAKTVREGLLLSCEWRLGRQGSLIERMCFMYLSWSVSSLSASTVKHSEL